MRLLVISVWGESELGWLMRCKAAGHEIRWFYSERKTPIGKGIIDVVDDWRPWMRWADVVFLTDNTKYLAALHTFRGKARPHIIGPSVEGASWELNRTLGMKILERHGIECPAYREFSDYDKAIAYVKKEDRAFVSKPCGDESDKSLSYVGKSPEALVAKLEGWKRAGKLKGSFILQELVKGVEMGTGGWFGPGGFNSAIEEDFEYKKMMPGNLGPNTGEMGTVVRYVRKSKLFDLVVKPLAPALERMGYLGCTNVNCIIDENGKPWPLEFTNRPGWPAFLIQGALTKGDPLEWMLDLAEGRDSKNMALDEIAVGVVLAIPPFPNAGERKEMTVGVPLYGMRPSVMEDTYFCQVMMGEAPQKLGGKIVTAPCYATAGSYVLVATGTGDTVTAARGKVYRTLDNLKAMPGDPFWRVDIGRDLSKCLPEIQAHGYATGMEF